MKICCCGPSYPRKAAVGETMQHQQHHRTEGENRHQRRGVRRTNAEALVGTRGEQHQPAKVMIAGGVRGQSAVGS